MTTPAERTRAFINATSLMWMCILPARVGGFRGIPRNVRKQFRVVLKHWPWITDLLLPEQFCRDTIDEWRAEWDRKWRAETSSAAPEAQGNVTRRKR